MEIRKAIKQAKENSTERKFTQSFDIIVNLKLTAKENIKLEELATLPSKLTKPSKVYALVGGELKAEAEKYCDKVILDSQFDKYRKPRKLKSLAREADFFIAQADIMPKIAQTFGKYFAPVGKMPNPRFGQVVPPKAKLKPIVSKFKQSVILRAKKIPVVLARIGDEKTSDEELASNAEAVINLLISKLPRGKDNIKNILFKTTMGRPAKL